MQMQIKIIMNRITIVNAAFLIVCLMLCACALERRPNPSVSPLWQPWTNEIASAAQLKFALESRFQLRMIQAYCDVTAPTPESVQNLVALGESWHGVMYQGTNTGFDQIWWYASTVNGQFEAYSVNAKKGRKYWNIEIGTQETLHKAPFSLREREP
jgi:hypothetical protein